MREFDGRDVIKSLKEDGILESRNIIIFTASSDRTLIGEMKNLGKEVFKKPCLLNDLGRN
jgi:hypothetical protein